MESDVMCVRELTKQIWKMYAFESRMEKDDKTGKETGKMKLYKTHDLKNDQMKDFI
jgi:hypothetical protein